ncbi:MAG TPA: Maf family protein [Chthonomonadales bacterium]|nr:Maf family protein [Chthonomonadales bacterium]
MRIGKKAGIASIHRMIPPPPPDSAPRLVLASASPRRHELLGMLGLPFTVETSAVDEDDADDGDPAALAIALAERKAADVAARLADGRVVALGADTVVVHDPWGAPQALAKPAGAADARRMLRLLSGAVHVVCTGAAVAWLTAGHPYVRLRSALSVTEVAFRSLSDEEIAAYAATGEPADKAGAYAIQGGAAAFVTGIRGDYWNVIGLGLADARRLLLPWFPAVGAPPALPPLPFAVSSGPARPPRSLRDPRGT